jgi:membrane protein
VPTAAQGNEGAVRLPLERRRAKRGVLRRARSLNLRRVARELFDCFEEHDLLTSASAISFQILTAIVPFLLFSFALLGFVNMGDVWHDHVAPSVRPEVSPAGYAVLQDTVNKVLGSHQFFWMTAGFVVAVWQVSGAVRAVMGSLNRIYRVHHKRPWKWRMLVSTGLAIAVGALLLGSIAVVSLGPLLYGDVGQPAGAFLFVLRWSIAGALMLAAVGLLLRFGPATRRPMRWVSFGSLLVIGSWILMSIGFGSYLHYVADYQSVFGNLATVVVLSGYIYMSSLVFLGGAQVDALTRRQVEPPPGPSPAPG